jgi:hypothetical protein
MPFLEAGLPVFVDKPLSLDNGDLERFEPHLRSGKLMSCSGLRFAQELDQFRQPRSAWPIGTPRLVEASVLFGIERYGIHLIEAIASLDPAWGRVSGVTRLAVPHDAWLITLSDGVPFVLHCLGPVGKTFHVSLYGDRAHCHFDLHDNFSAFRRTLERFFQQVKTGTPAIDPDETLAIMRLIQQARGGSHA